MKNWLFLVRREFGFFRQNKVFVFAFLVMPVVISLVLGFVYIKGEVTRVPVLVVDNDVSPLSAKLIQMLEDNNSIEVFRARYKLAGLEKAVVEYRVAAVIVIPNRFEADVLSNKRPDLNCYLNMGNSLTAGVAGAAVNESAGLLNAGMIISNLEIKGLPPIAAAGGYETFKNNIFLQYNPAGNYLMFLWPGLVFSLLHQLLLLALAVSFSQEIVNGTFNSQGLLQYSHSALVLISVKIVPYALMSFFTLCMYSFLGMAFKMPVMVHPGVMLLSELLLVLGTCLLGTVYSIIFPLPLKASQLLMSIASPAFSISGFNWPKSQEPSVLQSFAEIVPLTPFLRILRLTWIQGASYNDVLPQIHHQILLILIYGLLCFALLKFKMYRVLKQERVHPAPVII